MERDDEPQRAAAMSKEDPERTRLGAHLDDADDTAADTAEEGGRRTYAGEEADVTGRPQDAEGPEPPVDRPRYQDEPARADRPGGGGAPLFADDEEADLRERPRSPGER
jgi:hypothetical protein